MKTTSILIIATLLASSLSWHEFGHTVVARIAEKHLATATGGQAAYNWIKTQLAAFQDYCGEGQYLFLDASTWADKVMTTGWTTMETWHHGYFYQCDIACPPKSNIIKEDLSKALFYTLSSISSSRTDPWGESRAILGKSLNARNLLNLIGQAHLPLSTVSRVSTHNPNGNKWGSLFPIQRYQSSQNNNLLYAWKNMFELGDQSVTTPLTQAGFNSVDAYATSLMNEHSYQSLLPQMQQNKLPTDWIYENFDLNKNVVYNNIQFGGQPSSAYVSAAQTVIKRRLALAGYRLADTLITVYNQYEAGQSGGKTANEHVHMALEAL